jgi:tripartite tricarboxylate transporter TctB family protein
MNAGVEGNPPAELGGGIADRVVSCVVAALGLFVIDQSLGFDLHTPAGPWLVPLIVGILLTVLGAWGVVRPERGASTWFHLRKVPMALTALILAAYVFVMPIVGFLAATIATSIALSLPGPLQPRMRIAVCLSGTAVAVGMYLLFVHVFNVPLPDPVWANAD